MNQIIQGDALEVLKTLESESVDMVLTSPPYDNLRDYKGYSFDFEGIAKGLFRVLKQGGVIVWVVGDATIDGSESGTSFRQVLFFKDLGLNLHDTMIYSKQNYIPLTHNRYEQKFEYMFVLTKGSPKTFNPLLERSRLAGKSIQRFNTARTREAATRNRDEATTIKETKYRPNIWEYVIGRATDNGSHPAAFPEALVADHISSWSNEGDLVLDPMNGSGTTTKMAKLLGREYIGIDISKEYCDIAEKRLLQQTLI